MSADLPGPGSYHSADDGADAGEASYLEAAAVRFESILFEQPGAGPGAGGPEQPEFFADLNLDQVLKSMTAGREQYELEPLFCTPLHEVSAVSYRHEVLRDLEKREVLEPVSRFAEAMRRDAPAPRAGAEAPLQAAETGMVPGRGRDLLHGGTRAGQGACGM